MEIIGCRQLFDTNILQNISFFFAQQNIETHSGLEHLEGWAMMTDFFFFLGELSY